MQEEPSPFTIENFKQVEYENYSVTSKTYDMSRYPVGLDSMISIIKEQLKKQKQNNQKTVLLDVGCGTGNYLLPVSQEFDNALGIDLNQGMVAEATKKVHELKKNDKISVTNGIAQKLPPNDGSVSVVIACQTIHHYGAHENIIAFIKEAMRVLKPGGMLIINHSTQEQVQGEWFIHFSERVREECKKRYLKRDDLIKFAQDSGFKLSDQVNTKQTCQKKQVYLNPKLFLTAEGRAQDSVWSLYNEEELKVAMEKLQSLIDENKFEQWRMKQGGGDIEAKLGNNSHFVFTKE